MDQTTKKYIFKLDPSKIVKSYNQNLLNITNFTQKNIFNEQIHKDPQKFPK
jgi:hypothetical protein